MANLQFTLKSFNYLQDHERAFCTQHDGKPFAGKNRNRRGLFFEILCRKYEFVSTNVSNR